MLPASVSSARRAGAGPVVYWMSRTSGSATTGRCSTRRTLLCVTNHRLRSYSALRRNSSARRTASTVHAAGLEELEQDLAAKGIPFFLLAGEPSRSLPLFLKKNGAALLVTDFDPLKIKRAWKNAVARAIRIPFLEVDAHNIVPCWTASPKMEYGAYTLRPKLQGLLPSFLTGFPRLAGHPFPWPRRAIKTDWQAVRRGLQPAVRRAR